MRAGPGILAGAMQTPVRVPESLYAAGKTIRAACRVPLESLTTSDFISAWVAIAYLFPGLHPDGITEADNAWPQSLRRFVSEAWRRFDAGDISDEELYCCDATWAGVYDRMTRHTPEETARRMELSAGSAGSAHA